MFLRKGNPDQSGRNIDGRQQGNLPYWRTRLYRNYTFSQKSLTRKGIRMLVDVNGEKAVLDIKTEKASTGKILHVDLLDANYNKPTRPFAYGNWIIARVHCVDMEFLPVKVILWEDDGDKTKQNTTNVKIEVKEGDILNGKADVAFYLDPSHAWLANAKLAKGDKDEGKFHEYYVTAEIFEKVSKRIPSKNANVPNPDYKPEAKPPVPAEQKGPSKKETKGIAKSENKVHDYHEQKVAVEPIVRPDLGMEIINSLMMVDTGGVWGDKKEEKKGACPNCDLDITLDQIKKICVDKKGKCLIEDDAVIKLALPHLNIYRKKVGINTCVRKAHFLAQIAQESKFYDLEEGFNYYWESLIATFGAFTSVEGKKYAKLWGREIKDKGAKGYKAVTQENQINIANWAYKNNNSNKDFASGDGYKYRGRGFKQITWKSNYKALSEYFNKNMKVKNEADVNWEANYSDLMNKPKDAMTSALAYWGKNNINSAANENSAKAVEKVTKKINSALKGLEERKSFFKNAVDFLKVNDCKKGSDTSAENGTIIIVSGTDTKKEKDPAQDIHWVMYKTSVYRDMSLQNYKKLKASKKLPNPDYTTYLSRDTHQTYSKKKGNFKHSDKRFGQYNEIPPGEYFLVPGVSGQTYKIYVVDSEIKGASSENGIDGLDGARGGVALHQYCPRFSVGCFTFNSGTDITPVTNFIKEVPDLKLKDDKPVRFIVEERKVVESTWDDPKKGTKKWTGI